MSRKIYILRPQAKPL